MNSRLLIAVVSCEKRSEQRALIRRTWLPTVPLDKADVRFFVGRDVVTNEADVIRLDCGDSYQELPDKAREIARWALAHGYRWILKVDDDVVLNPQSALASGFEQHDFIAREFAHGHDAIPNVWHFGFARFLSARAMNVIANSPLPCEMVDWAKNINRSADDFWAESVLAKAGIFARNDLRMRILHQHLPIPRRFAQSYLACVHTPDRSVADFEQVFREMQNTDLASFGAIRPHLTDLQSKCGVELLPEELIELLELSQNDPQRVLDVLRNSTVRFEAPLGSEMPGDFLRVYAAESHLLAEYSPSGWWRKQIPLPATASFRPRIPAVA